MRKLLALIALAICAGSYTMAQFTIIVDEIPDDTPAGSDIYVAGNFNGWDDGSPDYILEPEGDVYSVTFSPAPGMLEFKFTRGSWATVEGNEFGGYLPNRTYMYDGGTDTLYCQILTWEDTGGPVSTAAWNVEVLSDDFYMPQLDTYRRIWIYLPPDYYLTDHSYKVLYMHDGQNVFDVSTSFAGEWEVDETLNDLFDNGDEGCIVVAIDNGGVDRLEEYCPWEVPAYDIEGHGELYLSFIVETLKPYIDENFRTLSDREHTGLMGSSLGGLITHFGGFTYNEVFSRLGVFSPSYWISDSCFTLVESSTHNDPMRIYSIAGTLEGTTMTGPLAEMEEAYTDAGLSTEEHITFVHPDGQHSEWYWAREFKDAYEWLWDETVSVTDELLNEVMFYPNPAVNSVRISGLLPNEPYTVNLFDLQGRVIPVTINGNEIGFSCPDGCYLLRLTAGGATLTRSIVVSGS
jgi:predicted alpha/beta superfamily hydrolase